jgi:hypothetical protein
MIRNRARQAGASLPDRPAGPYLPGSKALPTP